MSKRKLSTAERGFPFVALVLLLAVNGPFARAGVIAFTTIDDPKANANGTAAYGINVSVS